MTIYPAIDIRGGACVRLLQGRPDAQTTYHDDPLAPALEFAAQGAKWVHVVDLDGAFEGAPRNLAAVSRIAQTGMKVELGGGLRTREDVEAAFEAGAARAIIGTRACENPDFVRGLVEHFGAERIAAGIDAKGGRVALRGWVDTSEMDAIALAKILFEAGVETLIYTDISTDGMLGGPNYAAQEKMCRAVPACRIVASGGVSRLSDVEGLLTLAEIVPNLEGVVIGKAIYEKKLSLKDALASARQKEGNN